MEGFRTPEIKLETLWRTILVTDARDSSKAYFQNHTNEAFLRIEQDRVLFLQIAACHGGEEIRDRGDGSMFAFCDPIEALTAAMEMQQRIADRNAERPEEAFRLIHRMGIHMGPVKLATTRVRVGGGEALRHKMSGDLMVTAARLEAICHPGEVCFSNDVYRAVHGRIEHPFRFLDATLKGFDRPMRCWSTRLDPEWTRPLTAEEEQALQKRKEERRLREKWEREQREKWRRAIALRVASAFAALSVAFAGFRFVQTQDDLQKRLERAWAAFSSPLVDPVRTSAPVKPVATPQTTKQTVVAVASRPHRAQAVRTNKPRSKDRLSSVARDTLAGGDAATVSTRLAAMSVPERQFQAVCDDAERFVRARDWLAACLEPAVGDETKGLPLEPPVAGMVVLTRAAEQGVAGLDASDRRRSIPYARLAPNDFRGILRAACAGGGSAPLDTPETSAASLASLQRLSRRRDR